MCSVGEGRRPRRDPTATLDHRTSSPAGPRELPEDPPGDHSIGSGEVVEAETRSGIPRISFRDSVRGFRPIDRPRTRRCDEISPVGQELECSTMRLGS